MVKEKHFGGYHNNITGLLEISEQMKKSYFPDREVNMMGAWGPKLYQDDIAEEVRDYYKDQLHREKTGKEITQELMAQNEDIISDPDDAPVFWFALADTQWNLGRLEEEVKKRALDHIHDGYDLSRWKAEDCQEAKIREKVLRELEEKLLSLQPAEKKISQYKLYHCDWKFGDVYAYPLNSEYAKEKGLYGRYFLFQKIGETIFYPGHIIPIVWVKITEADQLPLDKNAFEKLEYVQTSAERFDPFAEEFHVDSRGLTEEEFHEKVNRKKMELDFDEFGYLPQYRIALINTSKRIIPKSLVFVGNYQNTKPPQKEFVPCNELSIPSFVWKFFDKIMIDRYCGYNLRQFETYSHVRR